MLALQPGSMKEYQKQLEQREAVQYGKIKAPYCSWRAVGAFKNKIERVLLVIKLACQLAKDITNLLCHLRLTA